MRIYSGVSLLFILFKIFDICNVLRLDDASSATVAVDSKISFGSRNTAWIGHELGYALYFNFFIIAFSL